MNNKILHIYNLSTGNSDKINELNKLLKNENVEVIEVENYKKIIEITRDWEPMEQFYSYDGSNEKVNYGNWYKNYIIKLHTIPVICLPYISFSILFIYGDSTTPMQEYFSRNIFNFINRREESGNGNVEDVTLYIPYEILNTEGTSTAAKQIKSKLILKIYNPHYFE